MFAKHVAPLHPAIFVVLNGLSQKPSLSASVHMSEYPVLVLFVQWLPPMKMPEDVILVPACFVVFTDASLVPRLMEAFNRLLYIVLEPSVSSIEYSFCGPIV